MKYFHWFWAVTMYGLCVVAFWQGVLRIGSLEYLLWFAAALTLGREGDDAVSKAREMAA